MKDAERIQLISELIDLYDSSQDFSYLLRRIPLQSDDPEDKKFEAYFRISQMIIMYPTLSEKERCFFGKYIVEMNKFLHLPILVIEDYYKQYCVNNSNVNTTVGNTVGNNNGN